MRYGPGAGSASPIPFMLTSRGLALAGSAGLGCGMGLTPWQPARSSTRTSARKSRFISPFQKRVERGNVLRVAVDPQRELGQHVGQVARVFHPTLQLDQHRIELGSA